MSEPTKTRKNKPSKDALKDALKAFDSHLEKITEKGKEEKKEVLVKGIEKIEKEHKDILRSSRVITEKILSAREQAGISTAVGTSGKIKSPRILGKKDFQALLQRELLLIGTEELKHAGGLISIDKLYKYFMETRPNWKIKQKEIENALKEMEKTGVIPGIIKEEKETFVLFKPLELDTSVKQLLIAASGGITKIKDLANLLGWDLSTVKELVKTLETQGLCVVEEDEVFFPGMF